jgi:hypothetical protein
VRIFCDPAFVDSVEASIDWGEGVEILKTSLEQALEWNFFSTTRVFYI